MLAAQGLPDYGTPFVGRETDLRRIDRVVAEGATLVSLVGPGGIGKTRLAVEHARLSARDVPVGFCELTPARTAEDVSGAMVAALALAAEAGPTHADSATRVGLGLARLGRAVIVVNNVEHVAAVAPFTIGVWRTLAPDVRFVVTSREPLRLPGEAVISVAALDTEGARSAALELLHARIPPGLSLSAADEETLAELIGRLGGQPLAIELVAAHLPLVSARTMLERFDAAHLGDVAPSALEWAWGLLAPAEQEALRQMSAFAASFTRDAARAVVRLPDDTDLEPVIDSLVHKRLLVPLRQGGDRLSCVESMRERGEILLHAVADDVEAVHARHRGYYLDRCAAWAAAIHGHEGLAALSALAAEHDNLHAVLRRALEHRPRDRADVEVALRAVLALHPVLALRSPLAVQIAMLDDVVAAASAFSDVTSSAAFARLLHERGYAFRYRGRMDECTRDLERALALARDLDDRALVGLTLVTLSTVHGLRGQPAEEQSMLEEALSIAKADGLARLEGVASSALGVNAVRRGALDDALPLLDRALAIVRSVGDRRFEGIVLTQRGALELEQNRVAESVRSFEQAIAIHTEVGNRRFEATATGNLSIAHHLLGDLGAARRGYLDALGRLEHLGERRFHAYYVAYLALLDLEENRLAEARSGLNRALSALRPIADPRYEGIATAALAGERMLSGDDDEARALLDEAREVLADAGDPLILPLVEVYEGIFEVVEGSHAEGARREELLARARVRAERLTTLPADDVRLANRTLLRLLAPFAAAVAPPAQKAAPQRKTAKPMAAPKKAAPKKKAVPKKVASKKAVPKKAPKKAAPKKAAPKKAAPKKAAPKKAAPRKAAPRKAAPKKAAPKKAAPKKAAPKKAAPKKAAPKKAAPKKAAPKKAVPKKAAAPEKRTASKKGAPKRKNAP
ncbi:MAG: tetratricopeptide repeat protein [Deltaproteobacteria bacterium]|nr:tetratricopeptide repeat protein [Deltaproteobacteria bacterium]